jgi:hypothetical protein
MLHAIACFYFLGRYTLMPATIKYFPPLGPVMTGPLIFSDFLKGRQPFGLDPPTFSGRQDGLGVSLNHWSQSQLLLAPFLLADCCLA